LQVVTDQKPDEGAAAAAAARKAAEQSLTAAQDGIASISRVANAAGENIDRAFTRESEKVHALEQTTSRIEKGLRDLTTEMGDRFRDLEDSLQRMVAELSVAVDVLSKRKSWLQFIWPFKRR
jgi:DNA anti-recombination protein RmuC